MTTRVLIVFYSRHGSTQALANELAFGVDSVAGCESVLRRVPEVTAKTVELISAVPDDGCPYVSRDELKTCDALLLGSPTRFGNMAAPLKHFIDSTSGDWLAGTLSGKPGGVFTSTSSLHGGQESTLLSMALPLLHHGMLLTGLPYTVPELSTTTTGGSPYGVTHHASDAAGTTLSADEVTLAREQGKRIARLAVKLRS